MYIHREREREIFQMTECLRILAIWFVRNVSVSCDIERRILRQIDCFICIKENRESLTVSSQVRTGIMVRTSGESKEEVLKLSQ